ncbi:cytochrome oxidase c subunit VIb-domain-containing protein [Cristinia sonorae]|uniref:Cytochrome oxidase c subunit VIb-domain-containing protein n=1 Tax=Cristinia sonorae TaxID=1940300 RepID=A0A8K0UKE5_9AGAR|nr:cytochrome oxidase c subunit VIb-domain-containing protein [Cristinia sonorae]
MGWFSSDKKPEPEPLLRQDRQKCWESRDAYFACLDSAGVVKPGTEGSTCSAQQVVYEQNCAKSWVSYFNQRRVLAEQQRDVLATVNTQAAAANRR